MVIYLKITYKSFDLKNVLNHIFTGMTIEVINEKNPECIPWSKVCAQYVIESSGCFTTLETAKV